ncbi:hypothetical protein N7466_003738 [Penicillium verhagenii]|uniref:uncharacterized protein n=1 Tax=Penicillium verhagenii TaxID=1562060 RepID=UPI0025451371|nr:uncharacterized protein N7466_003738 [Penicillium verhagenii]KAJ5934191.1 hypothetical protein N7466_003738 [Penicillium verhagenii]
MATTRVADKSLELLRSRLLEAVRKEATALVSENFGSPEDIDRHFRSLFQAEVGPRELAGPDQANDEKSIYGGPSIGIDPERADQLAKPIRDNLVGVWKILEFSLIDKSDRNQKIHPWGTALDGQVIFTPDGYFNGVVEIPGQAPFGGDEPWTAGTTELAESARRTCSYSGKFFVERGTNGASMLYDLSLCNYPVFRGEKFRVFIDFVKKDNQLFLITTLTCNDSARQKQEVLVKI